MKPFVYVIVAALLLCLCCEAQAQDAAPFPTAPTSYRPAPEDPSGLTWGQVWGILACLGLGGTIGGGGVWMCRRTTIDPQPLAVTLEKEFATKEELLALAKKVDEETAKIANLATKDELTNLSNKLDSEIGKISGRIDNTNSTLAEIKGELKGISSNQDKILGILLKQ